MDIYEKLGVKRVISCCGTFTILGGALMDPRVLDAMKEASQTHVVVEELQQKAGQYVADLIGVEGAFITTGAAGGLLLASAALLAGTDPARMRRLPDTSGMKNEVIICKSQRFSFDQAIRTAGARFVEIGDGTGTEPWEMEDAINERTAFCLWVPEHNEEAALPFEVFCGIGHAHGIPILVDHAAEVPPVSNLRKYTDLGADLVIFSGGKGLRGPQCTGLILGRRDLIAACAANSSPRAAIGRPLKVGKEEICGMVTALELYITEISKKELDIWEAMVAFMVEHLQGMTHVHIRRQFPYHPTREVPVMVVEITDGARLTAAEVVRQLREGEPPIYVPVPKSGFGYPPGRGFIVNPHTMLLGEERVVARRLRELLSSVA